MSDPKTDAPTDSAQQFNVHADKYAASEVHRSGASLPVKPTSMTDQRGFRAQLDDLSTTKGNKVSMPFTEFRHLAIHRLKR